MDNQQILDKQKESFAIAMSGKLDIWVPACSGTEMPFETRMGRRLQYCFNPGLHRHAYLDCQTDIILTDEEAGMAIGLC